VVFVEEVGAGEKAAGGEGMGVVNAVDEVVVGLILEVFAAVSELTTRGFGEEELGVSLKASLV